MNRLLCTHSWQTRCLRRRQVGKGGRKKGRSLTELADDDATATVRAFPPLFIITAVLNGAIWKEGGGRAESGGLSLSRVRRCRLLLLQLARWALLRPWRRCFSVSVAARMSKCFAYLQCRGSTPAISFNFKWSLFVRQF